MKELEDAFNFLDKKIQEVKDEEEATKKRAAIFPETALKLLQRATRETVHILLPHSTGKMCLIFSPPIEKIQKWWLCIYHGEPLSFVFDDDGWANNMLVKECLQAFIDRAVEPKVFLAFPKEPEMFPQV
ncbi:MAG: hypothetical protein NTW73_02950 [Candidatus Parcubacteria bacterium]|nr:hypothetical protein [Candidatus Parcubacteria bacterium]